MQWTLYMKKHQAALAAFAFVLGFSLISPLVVQGQQKKPPTPPASDGCKVKATKKLPSALSFEQFGKLKPGDTVGELKVKNIEHDVSAHAEMETYTVTFCEPIQVTGSFTYLLFDEGTFLFKPDNASLKRIPHFKKGELSDRHPTFALNQIPPALIKKFGNEETSGTATFTLNNVALSSPTEAYFRESARLSKISSIQYISVATLPDGTKLYENRKPLSYKNIKVSALNTGSSSQYLFNDVANQLPHIPEEELRIIDVIDVKRNDKSKSPVRIVLMRHKETYYYIALDHRKLEHEDNHINTYALVAQIKDEDRELAFKYVLKIIQSWTPNVYFYI